MFSDHNEYYHLRRTVKRKSEIISSDLLPKMDEPRSNRMTYMLLFLPLRRLTTLKTHKSKADMCMCLD